MIRAAAPPWPFAGSNANLGLISSRGEIAFQPSGQGLALDPETETVRSAAANPEIIMAAIATLNRPPLIFNLLVARILQ